jgi:hypothetical protein
MKKDWAESIDDSYSLAGYNLGDPLGKMARLWIYG